MVHQDPWVNQDKLVLLVLMDHQDLQDRKDNQVLLGNLDLTEM